MRSGGWKLQKLSTTRYSEIVFYLVSVLLSYSLYHFLRLQQLLEPFGITTFYTDGWGTYERHLDAEQHQVGKENTQKIESKHINLRTRIKRLVRRTICFSKTERMHDLVIGLFINRYEFERLL
jgi:insertion element IS1 protein InsB